MYVSAVLLAAGEGSRFKSSKPKPLVKIDSQPIIIHCLRALTASPVIKDVVVVVNKRNRSGIISSLRKYKISKIGAVVLGGRRRQDSLRLGLEALKCRADFVLVHDAARPFLDKAMISRVINAAWQDQAAIAGVPVKSTIKTAIGRRKLNVGKTIDRQNLWEIQTPQVFKRSLIEQASEKFRRSNVTDDAMLVEKLGAKVRVVMGSYNNIKITTPEDLVIAQAIAKSIK